MRIALALVLLLLPACLSQDLPIFTWATGTHPRAELADGTTDPTWTSMVESARAEWSGPLVALGCDDPFRGSDSNPVYLIPDADWRIPGAIGNTQSWGIVVRGTVATMNATHAYESVLPHELGHALGLTHVLDGSDPLSVMHEPADRTHPSALDVEHAAEAIGCR